MAEDPLLPAAKGWPVFDPMLEEEDLIRIFTQRVEEMMRDEIDLLLSSLYRLDVEEEKIQQALHSSTVPPARGIAILILERQKERLKTRQAYKTQDPGQWEGL